MKNNKHLYTRRDILKIGAASTLIPWLPRPVFAADPEKLDYELTAANADVQLVGDPFAKTEIWGFNNQSPGPLLRFRQGVSTSIKVKNELEQPITVHWHGLRIPNPMDGVPMLTQPPIQKGEEFLYEFTPPDAGTYWYHSHLNTAEQVDRGLYGPIIIEEKEAPPVDRDEVWVLDDWRLDKQAKITGDYDNQRDLARAGRLGNTVTINGKIPKSFRVRSGERIRLRLINAANARIFALRFQAHHTLVIARDGQPLEPYEPGGPVVIGPAQRFDLILDMTEQPGDSYSVIDTFYPQSPSRLLKMVYSDEPPIRREPLGDYPGLPKNIIAEPDLNDPQVQLVDLKGGDLGLLKNARMGDKQIEITRLYLLGKMWAINDVVNEGCTDPPMFTVERGRTVLLDFKNHSAWPHPMHLHGHHFKVIEHSRDREVIGKRLDTVLLGPEESAKAAFVADNPGDWMFHCHILGHAMAGMMAIIRVT
jgi:FtsP/CotA-like multicopper oxidase with cupredoxin domain